ncbi:MAG: hypothetical protein CM15mP85_21940 [Rhodobacterales bacterium]|nr:MAG: hypothetical protein CM15mP85_21940 [Rhodobacterales bacterium]
MHHFRNFILLVLNIFAWEAFSCKNGDLSMVRVFFNSRKNNEKVLLTTTAVVFTAGWASAGDMSMSGSVSLTYGSFGTGSLAATGTDDFTSEALLNVAHQALVVASA